MQIKFIVDELLPQLSLVASVVNAKNAMPILDDVLFEPITKGQSNARVKLTTTDNDNRISVVASVSDVTEDCTAFCVSARSLLQTLKSLSGMSLTLDIDNETHLLKGAYKNGKFTLPIDNVDDFPPVFGASDDDQNKAEVLAGTFAQALSCAEYAVGNDALRPTLNGVKVDFAEGSYTLAGTDSQKLSRVSVAEACGASDGFILPTKPAHIISSMFAKSKETLSISYNSKNVLFRADNFELHSRVIDGRYPNYNSVIPTDNNIVFEVDSKELLSALQRTMVFGNQHSNLVVLSLEMGSLKVEAEDVDFSTSASETIDLDYAGVPIKIGFKGSNLQQVVQNTPSEKVCIKLKEPSRAALICPSPSADGVDCVSLLMPMMLSD